MNQVANIRQRVVSLKFYESSRNAEELAEAILEVPREIYMDQAAPRFNNLVASLHFDATNVNPAAYRQLGDINTKRVLGVVRVVFLQNFCCFSLLMLGQDGCY